MIYAVIDTNVLVAAAKTQISAGPSTSSGTGRNDGGTMHFLVNAFPIR